MNADPIPAGEDPFTPDGNVEILINSEGAWFDALDVVALLRRLYERFFDRGESS